MNFSHRFIHFDRDRQVAGKDQIPQTEPHFRAGPGKSSLKNDNSGKLDNAGTKPSTLAIVRFFLSPTNAKIALPRGKGDGPNSTNRAASSCRARQP